MLPSYEALLTVFISSLLGSLHCVGMCGGLVALCCISNKDGTKQRIYTAEAAYHLMRLVSYATLGLIAGFLGEISDNLSAAAGFQQGFAIVAGSILIIWGSHELGLLGRAKLLSESQAALSIKIVSQKLFKKPLMFTGTARGAFIGLLSGLLPCGWLYAYVIAAAATQNPVAGAILMITFWLGTVPILILLAGAIKKLDSKLLSKLPKLTAALIIILGIMMIAGKINAAENSTQKQTTQNHSCH